MPTRSAFALLLTCCPLAGQAQLPHILGTWKLNADASRLPGLAPQTEVRRYSLEPDGTIVGLAVVVDAGGNPGFFQFAAKPDGKEYPEFDHRSAARFLMDGSQPPATYAETPLDSHTVQWVDKYQGLVAASGRKWVSADGQTLSVIAIVKNERNEEMDFLFVYDRVLPPAVDVVSPEMPVPPLPTQPQPEAEVTLPVEPQPRQATNAIRERVSSDRAPQAQAQVEPSDTPLLADAVACQTPSNCAVTGAGRTPLRLVFECNDGVTFAVRMTQNALQLYPPQTSSGFIPLSAVAGAPGVHYRAGDIDFRSEGDVATLQIGRERHVDCVANPAAAIWQDPEPRAMPKR